MSAQIPAKYIRNKDAMTKWAPLIASVEKKHGMPAGMLMALAAKESGFDPNAKNKWSGASGMMQLMPKIHTSINPFNPNQAIPYAGSYLASMKKRFGTWTKALAGYNWGPGNVNKWIAGTKKPPKETVEYMTLISLWTPTLKDYVA